MSEDIVGELNFHARHAEADERVLHLLAEAAGTIQKYRIWLSEHATELGIRNQRITDLETAKVSIDVDSHFDGDGLRVYGRVVDWQYEDYTNDGKGKGVRLLCEYESDNFGMRRA